jgi:cytochrome c oxidase subunit 4
MPERAQRLSTYYGTFAALIGLTLLTVGLAFVPLGRWHTVTGLLIAGSKATLVALVFMHLWHSRRLVWLVVGGGLFWLALLMGLTLTDYLSRAITRGP